MTTAVLISSQDGDRESDCDTVHADLDPSALENAYGVQPESDDVFLEQIECHVDKDFLDLFRTRFRRNLIDADVEKVSILHEKQAQLRDTWLTGPGLTSSDKKLFLQWMESLTEEVLRRAGRITRKFIRLYHLEGHTFQETAALMGCSVEDLWSQCGEYRVSLLYGIAGRGLAEAVPSLLVQLIKTIYVGSDYDDQAISVILGVPEPAVTHITERLEKEGRRDETSDGEDEELGDVATISSGASDEVVKLKLITS